MSSQSVKVLAYSNVANLGIGASLLSPAIDCTFFPTLSGLVVSDQAGTIEIWAAAANGTYYKYFSTAVAANTPITFSVAPPVPLLKVGYTNGGVAQTSFALSAYLVANN